MELDPAGELIRTIGSESGHAIAADRQARPSGLNDPEAVPAGLFFGLGSANSCELASGVQSIQLSSRLARRTGGVLYGFDVRYGRHDRLHQLAKAQFEAAALFEYHRLPELFSGHARDEEHPIPALYPHADSPQAWSSSAVPCMIQAMLGLFPYAPLDLLFLDPHLPEWLPEITLRQVRVGAATVDLEFRRTADGRTGYKVLELRGNLHIVRQPSPWSDTTTFAERLIDLFSSALPGH